MKKLLLICFIPLQLSGCVLYDAYFMANYDNVEYSLINKIRTLSQTIDCNDKDKIKLVTNEIWYTTKELKNFSQYVPRNENSYLMASNLLSIVDGLHNKNGDMSVKYCEDKYSIINKTSEIIQKAIGSKPR